MAANWNERAQRTAWGMRRFGPVDQPLGRKPGLLFIVHVESACADNINHTHQRRKTSAVGL
jgi:hypothetical protein